MPGMVLSLRSASSWPTVEQPLQRRGHRRGPDDRLRPDALHPGPVPLPGRDAPPDRRLGEDSHAGRRGPRRLGPELVQQDLPRPVRLEDHDLLLEDRRDQRLHQPPGPAQPEPRIAAGRVRRSAGGTTARTRRRRHRARARPEAPRAATAPPAPTPAPAPASTADPSSGETTQTDVGSTRIVPGPSGVSDVRQIAPPHRPGRWDPRAPPRTPESPGRQARRAPATQPRASAHPCAAPTRPMLSPAPAQTRAIRRVDGDCPTRQWRNAPTLASRRVPGHTRSPLSSSLPGPT